MAAVGTLRRCGRRKEGHGGRLGRARSPKAELWILGAGHLPPYVTAGRQQDTVRAATADFLDAELLGSRAGLTRLAYDGDAPGLTSLVVDLG
jgi:hypothetical protein